MEYLLNSKEMKSCDTATIEHFGVPSAVLMERAALSVAEEMLERFSGAESFLIVCGSGNNGGDGLAIARLLFLKGLNVQIAFVGNEAKVSRETALQLSIVRQYGIPVSDEIPEKDYDVIVDSIFGIGLVRDIEGRYFEIIQQMNEKSGKKVAVDISSGVNANDGRIMGIAFEADLTVSFGFAKVGHILYPGAAYTGELVLKDIGIDTFGFLGQEPSVVTLTKEDLKRLPVRCAYSNKGTFGKVLVIAGSVNMAGAAYFSAAAAYHTGAGLVRVLTPEENRIIIQTALPEAVLTTYEKDHFDEEQLLECVRWASVIVVGPGIGTGPVSEKMVETVLKFADVPCIVDADGLNLIAKNQFSLSAVKGSLILTPHLGEMSRLCQRSISEIRDTLVSSAGKFAEESGAVVVLKDARTVTAVPDEKIYINQSGNSGMATGGSGDVLTGVIAGLVAQGCEPKEAAPLGVYLHGLVGDEMAGRVGSYSLTASDLIEGVGRVLSAYEREGSCSVCRKKEEGLF